LFEIKVKKVNLQKKKTKKPKRILCLLILCPQPNFEFAEKSTVSIPNWFLCFFKRNWHD